MSDDRRFNLLATWSRLGFVLPLRARLIRSPLSFLPVGEGPAWHGAQNSSCREKDRSGQMGRVQK